jgi:hypothetical protein
MSTQPEALRLAELLQLWHSTNTLESDAASELRRQHALIAELADYLHLIANTDPVDAALDPQRAVRVARAALEKVTL